MYQSLRVIAILLCGIVLASCSNSNQPDFFATYPTEDLGKYADWIVMLYALSMNESTGMVHYYITLESIPTDGVIPHQGMVSLSINNTNVDLDFVPMIPGTLYSGSIELPPNTEVQISLHGYRNQDFVHSCSLKLVDPIKDFHFTRLPDSHSSLSFNWTLNSNSQYQHLTLGDGPNSYFIKLNPELRSYTMPRSFLNSFFRLYKGYIALVESSYCIKDRILFRSISCESIRVQDE